MAKKFRELRKKMAPEAQAKASALAESYSSKLSGISEERTMGKRTRDYHSWHLQKLTDPEIVAAYLNAAMRDSPEAFQKALRNVAQARQIASMAKDADIQKCGSTPKTNLKQTKC